MNALSHTLTAAGHARQLHVVRRSDRSANQAERAVRRVWRELLACLKLPWHEAGWRSRLLLQALPLLVRQAIRDELASTARWGYASTRAGLARALPVEVLRGAYANSAKLARSGRITEGRSGTGQSGEGHRFCAPHEGGCPARPGSGYGGHLSLFEDESGPDIASAVFSWADLFAPFRQLEPDAGELPRADLLSLLFPAPSGERIEAIVYASGWQARIASGTGLASPESLAAIISTGLMLGYSQQEIARQILPAVQGVQSSARRIARTESLRVAAAVQMDAHEGLGDLVVGYQIHATLDKNTRAWHAKRDGTHYYARPVGDQKGYHQLPHPPEEAEDPNERPAGTPHTAWNCRCFVTPLLRPG